MNTNSTIKKAVIMTRVSSQEQCDEGQSLQAQKSKLLRFCDSRSFDIIKEYEFVESSTIPNRKKFNEMLTFVRKQKKGIILVVDAVDRLQRSFRETIELDKLRRNGRIEVFFLRENLHLHENSSSADVMLWDFAVLSAKAYVSSLSENVKRSTSYMLKDGRWPGRAPAGYINVREGDRNTIIPDDDRAHFVVEAFKKYSTGAYSVKRLAEFLKKKGLNNTLSPHRPYSKSQIHNMLNNTFYYGKMNWKGVSYKHQYSPLITRALFDKCQATMNGGCKKQTKYGSKVFVFKGLVECIYCKSSISFERKKEKYIYGYCTKFRDNSCDAVGLKEVQLLLEIEKMFKRFSIPQEELSKISELVRQRVDREGEHYRAMVRVLKKEQIKLSEKRSYLIDMKLDGSITRNEFDEKGINIDKRMNEVMDLLSEKESLSKDFELTINNLLELAQNAYEIFKSSEVEQQHELLNILLPKNSIDTRKPQLQAKPTFHAILTNGPNMDWLPRLDSNQWPID